MRTALKFIAKQRTKPLCESILLLQVLPFLNIRYGDSYYQAGSCAASECCSSAQHICATKAGYDQLLELIKSVSVHGRAPKQVPTLLALASTIEHIPTLAAKTCALRRLCQRLATSPHICLRGLFVGPAFHKLFVTARAGVDACAQRLPNATPARSGGTW
jgi:hypothetical protein